MADALFSFDNSFAREMEGFYASVAAEPAPEPALFAVNKPLAEQLGLDPELLTSQGGIDILSGNRVAEGSHPLAQAYAGHQFGGFSPSLGDGRALMIGEVLDVDGKRFDIQLKGSGRTPFSRNGDGKAALGPVLREYLVSEAMHALGIPTTRALSAVTTGQQVFRERPLPGAVLARVASSHIRVGTFQFFAARGQTEMLRQLTDYAIKRHDPDLLALKPEERALAFLGRVVERQAQLVAMWMSVGFIHGVMNTDNMTISGETIDYGPCAFMDRYDPETVYSSIDDHGRYAYKMQPVIAQWNLARLAETQLELLAPGNRDKAVEIATQAIEDYPGLHEKFRLKIMRQKIGLEAEEPGDDELLNEFLELMRNGQADFTLAFRRLSDALNGDADRFTALFSTGASPTDWLDKWLIRHDRENLPVAQRKQRMDAANPVYIPRNHLLEAALNEAVDNGESGQFLELLERVTMPFEEVAGKYHFAEGAPSGSSPHVTYCGT